VVEAANADEGVSVAVAPDTAIDAVTFDEAPAAWSVNVDDVNVDASIVWLKVTETVVPVETPVAPAAGDWLTTTGGELVELMNLLRMLLVVCCMRASMKPDLESPHPQSTVPAPNTHAPLGA
jgi:hypothetical protein